MKIIKTLVLAAVTALILMGAIMPNVAYAADLSAPPEVESSMTVEEINARIASLNSSVNYFKHNMEQAHAEANEARAQGLSEDCQVIKDAQRKYGDNKANMDIVLQDIAKLNNDKKMMNKYTYFDTFKLTGYCPCRKCCGKWANGITASGATAVEGITIAADTRVLPLGTKVFIEGLGERVVQDTGSAIKQKKLDIFVSYHSKAYGAVYNQPQAKVWIINE